MLIASWLFFTVGSFAVTIAIVVRVRDRLGRAREIAVSTYDRRRIMGGSKDDATTAAFMAQAMHICTAFDFLCCCLGLCRDGDGRYQRFDEEAPALTYSNNSSPVLVGNDRPRKAEHLPMPEPMPAPAGPR